MKKFSNFKKIAAALSTGYVMVNGVQQLQAKKIDSVIGRLYDIHVHSMEVDDSHPNLRNAYSNVISSIAQAASIKGRVASGDLEYYSYTFASIENELIDYTFYDDYITIVVRDPEDRLRTLCRFRYNNDGSYSIECGYDDDADKFLDRIKKANNDMFEFNDLKRFNMRYIIYNFSKEGILIDSCISGLFRDDIKFEYVNGDINKYRLYINKDLFIDNAGKDITIQGSDSLFRKDNIGKYNSIIPKIDFYFNFYIHDIKYSFDSNYKFNGLDAKNSYGESLKVDGSYNFKYKDVDFYSDGEPYYNYIFSDNKSLRITNERCENGKKVVSDEDYNSDGILISKKRNGKVIFKKDGNKDIYCDDEGTIEHAEEKVGNMVINHMYHNGVIEKSECDNYAINYKDGKISYIDVFKDGCEIEAYGVVYKLNKSDHLGFKNGVLSNKKIGNEEWYYYDGVNVSSYHNSLSNVKIHYSAETGDIDGCSFNYLNDKYKKIYDLKSTFDY